MTHSNTVKYLSTVSLTVILLASASPAMAANHFYLQQATLNGQTGYLNIPQTGTFYSGALNGGGTWSASVDNGGTNDTINITGGSGANNSVFIETSGTGNSPTIVQTGAGSNNSASIVQQFGDPTTAGIGAGITQTNGTTGSHAYITEQATNKVNSTSSTGYQNSAGILQSAATNSTASIGQGGPWASTYQAYAYITQNSTTGGYASIGQVGSAAPMVATITDNGGSNNYLDIFQNVGDGTALPVDKAMLSAYKATNSTIQIKQTGGGDTGSISASAYLRPNVNSIRAQLTQTGNSDGSTISLLDVDYTGWFGGTNVSVSQSGNNDTGNISGRNTANTSYFITQNGNYNTGTITNNEYYSGSSPFVSNGSFNLTQNGYSGTGTINTNRSAASSAIYGSSYTLTQGTNSAYDSGTINANGGDSGSTVNLLQNGWRNLGNVTSTGNTNARFTVDQNSTLTGQGSVIATNNTNANILLRQNNGGSNDIGTITATNVSYTNPITLSNPATTNPFSLVQSGSGDNGTITANTVKDANVVLAQYHDNTGSINLNNVRFTHAISAGNGSQPVAYNNLTNPVSLFQYGDYEKASITANNTTDTTFLVSQYGYGTGALGSGDTATVTANNTNGTNITLTQGSGLYAGANNTATINAGSAGAMANSDDIILLQQNGATSTTGDVATINVAYAALGSPAGNVTNSKFYLQQAGNNDTGSITANNVNNANVVLVQYRDDIGSINLNNAKFTNAITTGNGLQPVGFNNLTNPVSLFQYGANNQATITANNTTDTTILVSQYGYGNGTAGSGDWASVTANGTNNVHISVAQYGTNDRAVVNTNSLNNGQKITVTQMGNNAKY